MEQTTTLNVDKYIEYGLPMEKIPQTIKDAIPVTHELGLRYLWIDRFCILQNSSADKSNEIGQMRRVYRNAYVKIIAAKADKVSEGFLQDCPTHGLSYSVPFYYNDGKLRSMTLLPNSQYKYNQMKEPINSRGWCLQERILAPRALVYTSNTLQYVSQRGAVNIGNSHNSARISSVDRLWPQFFSKDLDKVTISASPSPKELQEFTDLW
jgi:hypothetical protein